MQNNALLYMFGTIFLLLGVFSPIINSEFGEQYNDYDSSIVEDQGQEDITNINAIEVLSAIFFWVFGAPVWINIFITMMRVVFWVIVYDKIRGI